MAFQRPTNEGVRLLHAIQIRARPSDHIAQTLAHVAPRMITKQASGLLHRRAAPRDPVPVAAAGKLDARPVADLRVDRFGKIDDPGFPAGCEIERLPDGALVFRARHHTRDDIAYISEVARLFAGTGDRQNFAA